MYFRNLMKSVFALIKAILLGVDRLGNALCGGDFRFTVSGRTGYFAATKNNRYWKFLEWVIDSTFYPIDGARHCYKAYQWEKGKKYRRGNDIALIFLSVIVIASCVILAPIIYLISVVK